MRTTIISICIAYAMLFVGCNAHNQNEHGEHDEHDEHHDTDNIHFTVEQAQATGLETESIVTDTFRYVIKTSGEIISSQSDEITISSTSSGIVSFAKSSFVEGTAISAGETIVTVSAQTLPEGDRTAVAKIEYEAALNAFERASSLVNDRIISQKEFEQVRLRYETAKMVYEAQASDYSTKGISISTPKSGFIKNLFVGQGDFVSVGQPIATISQNRRIQLRAEVNEIHFNNLNSITDANFKMAYDDSLYNVSNLNGKLLTYGRSINKNSFFIPVIFEFDNVGKIIPGSYVEVYLLSYPRFNVFSLPVSAITEEQGLHFIYLQLDEEHYKKQNVVLGQNDGARVEVVSGLNAGDIVVTKGVYQVKLAATPSAIPEGHSH